jgi:hypothetical protein
VPDVRAASVGSEVLDVLAASAASANLGGPAVSVELEELGVSVELVALAASEESAVSAALEESAVDQEIGPAAETATTSATATTTTSTSTMTGAMAGADGMTIRGAPASSPGPGRQQRSARAITRCRLGARLTRGAAAVITIAVELIISRSTRATRSFM